MEKNAKIYVAGHRGMVGSAIVRELERKLLDVSKATNLGWTYKTELEEGIRLSYEDFLNNPMRAER